MLRALWREDLVVIKPKCFVVSSREICRFQRVLFAGKMR